MAAVDGGAAIQAFSPPPAQPDLRATKVCNLGR